jgi:hypothetical protein
MQGTVNNLMENGHVAYSTLFSLKKSEFENHVSSTTTSGVRGFPLYKAAAMEEVKTTRFTDGDFAHDLRTLRVPFTAGSINCV